MVDVPRTASNQTPPENAIYLAWIPNNDPALPGEIIGMDLQAFSTVLRSGNQLVVTQLSYDAENGLLTVTYSDGSMDSTQDIDIDIHGERAQPVIGTVRLCFFDDQDAQFVTGTNGPYDLELLQLPEENLVVGDRVLVQCGSLEGGSRVVLRYGASRSDMATAPAAIVDGFVVFDTTQATTGFSLWLQGDHVGQLRFTRRAVYCCRGTNDLAMGAIKAALVSAVDPENFPPAYNNTRVYVPGERFHYQNAVYESLRHVIGQTPPNDTYYRKLLDGAAISNSDIDARIADWAEQGNTAEIPMAKLPDLGTDGIPANLVENFAKTNFPETAVPYTKLPALSIHVSNLDVAVRYLGDSSAAIIGLATDTLAGLLSPANKSVLDRIPAWLTDGSRAPKNRLPSDIVYGLPTYRGEWNSGAGYQIGQIVRTTLSGPQGGYRFWFAIANSSNINPLESNSSSRWMELRSQPPPAVTGVNPRGQWSASNSYVRGDVVTWDAHILICTVDSMAANSAQNPYGSFTEMCAIDLDVNFEGRVYLDLYDGGHPRRQVEMPMRLMYNRHDWQATDRYYLAENVVKNGGARYICLRDHQASSSREPGVSSGWADLWELW